MDFLFFLPCAPPFLRSSFLSLQKTKLKPFAGGTFLLMLNEYHFASVGVPSTTAVITDQLS